MLIFQNRSDAKDSASLPHDDYHCVEFTINAPHPIYQFKIRRTDEDNIFFLIKNDSRLLEKLKEGKILPMKYISGNGVVHSKICDTQITNIISEVDGRFRGHHRIELAVLPHECEKIAC